MKTGFQLLIAFAGAWGAFGQDQAGVFDPAHHITICLGEQSDVHARWAMEREEAIFAPTGVHVAYFQNGACPLGTDSIRIEFREAPASFRPGTLGYAYAFEGAHIVILLHRVEALALVSYPGPVEDMLAYVIAHEIAHVLEATDVHSRSGIMKAVWGSHEYRAIRLHKMTWQESDVEMIQSGMAHRTRIAFQNSQLETANR